MSKKNKKYEVKASMGLHTRRAIAYIILILLSILCLFWFYILLINCTRSKGQIDAGISFLPSKFLKINWGKLKEDTIPIISGLRNSVIVSICTSVLSIYFSALTAFAIHAYDFKGKNFAYKFIIAIMMIPTQVSSLGFVKICKDFGLDNSFLPLILPGIAAPITFFYIVQYMQSNLSLSLIEASRIDGSSEFATFNRIVMPLMKPALVVQAIFTIVSSWNNYYMPALLLQKANLKTLPVQIAMLRARDPSAQDYAVVYTMIAFAIFPVLIIYLLLSKFIVAGVTMGGVKE